MQLKYHCVLLMPDTGQPVLPFPQQKLTKAIHEMDGLPARVLRRWKAMAYNTAKLAAR